MVTVAVNILIVSRLKVYSVSFLQFEDGVDGTGFISTAGWVTWCYFCVVSIHANKQSFSALGHQDCTKMVKTVNGGSKDPGNFVITIPIVCPDVIEYDVGARRETLGGPSVCSKCRDFWLFSVPPVVCKCSKSVI